jgi:hypothetical protein
VKKKIFSLVRKTPMKSMMKRSKMMIKTKLKMNLMMKAKMKVMKNLKSLLSINLKTKQSLMVIITSIIMGMEFLKRERKMMKNIMMEFLMKRMMQGWRPTL